MIEYLKIQNFQSHRDTLLNFVPGVNVILGTSQNGKTAIARAINLLIDNRPMGCKYYSHFAPNKGETVITLKLNDQNEIVLEKEVKRKADKSKDLISTTYKLNKNEFNGARDVPDIIKNTLNISELNIQKQFDQPFLILSSAGEFARVINRITKLEKVDEWVSELKKRTNKVKNEVSLLESQCKDIELELKKYTGFEDLEEEIKLLQYNDQELQIQEDKFKLLDTSLESIELIEDELEKLQPVLTLENDINTIIQLEESSNQIKRTIDLIEKIKFINIKQEISQKLLEELELLSTIVKKEEQYNLLHFTIDRHNSITSKISINKDILEDCEKLIQIIEQEEKYKKLDCYISDIVHVQENIERLEESYQKYNNKLMKELENTKECPVFLKPCPVIKQMMKE